VRDDYPPTPIKTSTTSEAVLIDTGSVKIKAVLRPFRLAVFDKTGRAIFQERGMSHGAGNALHVDMRADEHFYGLGFQRMALDVRGRNHAVGQYAPALARHGRLGQDSGGS
jgi:hypothetical protein